MTSRFRAFFVLAISLHFAVIAFLFTWVVLAGRRLLRLGDAATSSG